MNIVPTPYTKTNQLVRSIAGAFDTATRQRIQMFLASLAPILVGLGLATTAETEQWLIISAAVIQAVAGILNLINLRGAWSIWKAVRGVIYTLATGVAPSLTLLGYIDPATSAAALSGLSLGLSSLSALIAIFTSKEQEKDVAVAEAKAATRAEQQERIRKLIVRGGGDA